MDAIDRLEHLLGTDWVGGGPAACHSLDGIFQNHAPWTRVYLAEVAETQSRLPKRIRLGDDRSGADCSSKEAANAVLECQVAQQARRSGLAVELQLSGNRGRQADLAISDGQARLLVEITSAAEFLTRCG